VAGTKKKNNGRVTLQLLNQEAHNMNS